jgi:protein-L-isoaspartate(D-aspartate) O-methyltransferase
MVDFQLRARGIKEERVIQAMSAVPRHLFVGPALRHKAYDDYPLPIGADQTISQPYMVAVMTEALQVEPGQRVLEIGTGSGYQTAILAELGAEVYTIERIEPLMAQARERLKSLGYEGIHFKLGDGSQGWPEFAPFDRILMTAGAMRVPEPLWTQIAEKGRMVLPLGDGESQMLTLFRCTNDRIRWHELMKCSFVPLVCSSKNE